MKMRMSVRRLEALIHVAGLGYDEMETSEDFDNKPKLRAAQEAMWYLHEWLREIKEVKS